MKPLCHLPMRHGFTLIELTIVLLVVSLMTSFGMQAMQVATSNDCYAKTREQMKTIRVALQRFADTNQRLPLPAGRSFGVNSPYYGREVTNSSSGASGDLDDIDTANSTMYGALPFQALQLPTSYAADCWGNKFSYLVGQNFVTTAGYNVNLYGPIEVRRGTLSTYASVTTKAIYAVISHGADALITAGRGGMRANYSSASHDNWCTVGTRIDSENCDIGNAILYFTDQNNGTTSTNFSDDLLIYGDYKQASWIPKAGYCWGSNANGQVGDNTTTQRLVPTAVTGGLTFTKIYSATNGACGLIASGAAYCWGVNTSGTVGDATNTERHVPTAVSGGRTYKQLDTGNDTACGVTTAGAGYCWGYNGNGTVGDGTTTSRNVPTAVSGGLVFKQISTHGNGTSACGITTAGAAYCWGNNTNGTVGDGTTTTPRLTPTAVSGGLVFTQIGAGGSTACGLTASGAAYCWGDNSVGSVGDGTTTTPRLTPTAVSGGLTFTQIAVGVNTNCGITTSGAAYCWGNNGAGQVGDGTTTSPRTAPTAVSGGKSFSQISVHNASTCGISTTGVAYCWGGNANGQVGDGTTTTPRTAPTAVSGGLTLMQISTGNSVVCGR